MRSRVSTDSSLRWSFSNFGQGIASLILESLRRKILDMVGIFNFPVVAVGIEHSPLCKSVVLNASVGVWFACVVLRPCWLQGA